MKHEQQFQALIDQSLSGLEWNERGRQQVLHAIQKEKKTMKKRSTALLLAAAMLVLSVTALAVGLVLSRQVDAASLAARAIENKYGVTSTMLGSFFSRTVAEQKDSTLVTFRGSAELAAPLGEYTVTVQGKEAQAVWSHDGKDTSGGYEADAWGAEQLKNMVAWTQEHHDVSDFYGKAIEAGKRSNMEFKLPPMPTDAEYQAMQAARKADETAAKKAAKLSEQAMIDLAKQAVQSVYGLTEQQVALMTCPQDVEEYQYFNISDGKPVYSVWLYLTQTPAKQDSEHDPFTEKDGIYVVDVNVETGTIESTHYDSALNGNG